MRRVNFALVDAFTTIPLNGNAAGVVLDPESLDDRERVAIAREIGASATVFLERLDEKKFCSRFFSTQCEIDLCGHASIAGFHHVAATQLNLKPGESATFVQETRVGDLEIEIVAGDESPLVTMDQCEPEFSDIDISPDKLAAMFGIAKKQIDEGLPVQIVSTGLRSLHVPIKSLSHFGDIKPLRRNLIELCNQESVGSVQLFTLETDDEASDAHVRVFAPAVGIDEDPVTGTASGALGAYLVHHGKRKSDGGSTRIVIEQGSEIGRPGRVEVTVEHDDDGITRVRVAGHAVTVAEGDLRIS